LLIGAAVVVLAWGVHTALRLLARRSGSFPRRR